jgi:hypothetical protein
MRDCYQGNCKRQNNTHTEPLFKKFEILPFNDLVFLARSQFMFLHSKNLTPALFFGTWVRSADRGLNLRNQTEFRIPFSRISLVEKLPLVCLPTTWSNAILDNVRKLPNIHLFTIAVKKILLERLQPSVTCNRLFCPSCSNI